MQMQQTPTGYPSIDRPWLKYYSAKDINTPLPDCTMYELICRNNQDNLDRVAMNYYGTEITYKKFFAEISLVSGALERLGIEQGNTVTIAMINSPETIYLLFALNKLGATANMVYGSSTPEELKKYLIDAGSTVVFTLDMFQEKFEAIAEDANLKHIVVANLTQSMPLVMRLGGQYLKGMKPKRFPQNSKFLSWKQFSKMKHYSETVSHDAEASAIITYTGGTTGGSKGAILSSRAVNAVAQQYIIGEQDLRRDRMWAQVLPLFIAYGVTCSLMIPLTVGMPLLVRIPMSESIADMCKKFRPNHIMYGPAYWEAFADEDANLDLSYFVSPITGGDTLRASAESKINAYLQKHNSPYLLMNGYGMTEVGAAVSVNYRQAHEFGSVGAPFVHNIVSAFDPDSGKELPCGQEGEICICTPSTMSGYVNNPEETANILRRHEDGKIWVHSGDLGYISKDGFIHISGRLKRYILCIANGIHKKVFSLDVERVLLEHPKIENCTVVPIDHTEQYQVPVAFVILKKGVVADAEMETDLKSYSEETLEEVYRPLRYFFVEKFPLTKVGKVDYLTLERTAREATKIESK